MHSVLESAPPVTWLPFPHVVIHPALPWDYYNALVEARPADESIVQGQELGSGRRIDMPTRSAELPPIWQEFAEYHTSRAFWMDVLRVFREPILVQYPDLEWRDGPLESFRVGVRKTGDFNLATECQLGINTPCLERMRISEPHFDNPVELYAGLLYMPHEDDPGGGDLEILKITQPPKIYNRRSILDECVEPVRTVEYAPNTAVFFINSRLAAHRVTLRGPTDVYRRLVNIIGEIRYTLFEDAAKPKKKRDEIDQAA